MNRKFILIGLLLVACFAFTVLQAATGEAQQCDPGPACVENCCGQCDPGPACVENCCGQCDPGLACVENCCPAGDPASGGDVTLDPDIDPQPAPSSNVTLDPNIDPQPYIKPKKQGKVQVQQHDPNRTVKPKKQGKVQVQQHGTMAPGKMAPGKMAPGKMAPGKMAPGTFAPGGDSSASVDCSQTPDDGWLSVTEVLSEADFQIGFNDAVMGRQYSKFDNDSSIVCVAGEVKDVYVGVAASDSNLGAFIDSGMGCNLRNDDLSSGGRGVDKLICP